MRLASGMAWRALTALVTLACSAAVAAAGASGAQHNATAATDPAALLHLPGGASELEYAREQLFRVSALLPNTQLRPGAPPVACSCDDFRAGNCFAPGCQPCGPECNVPAAQGPLRPQRGPLGTGLLCAAGGCEACCADPAQVANTSCALPPGGCPE